MIGFPNTRITSMMHKNCESCLAEARFARTAMGVSGSTMATHSAEHRSANATVPTVLHRATVARIAA